MKKSILLVAAFLIAFNVFSQNPVFWENFDTIPYGSHVTSSSSGTTSWGISTQLSVSGMRCDTATVVQSDTLYLTSNAFSTLGSSVVYLEFDQIAKVEFFDAAYLEISDNNGATWTRITNGYVGLGAFNSIGFKFACTSYVDWLPANNNAIPTNAWWKHEKFELSSYITNTAQAKIRFVLADANNTGAAGNYGWLLDNINVWVPAAQEASIEDIHLPLALPSGCGLGNEIIEVRIANNGSAVISGNLTANFQRDNGLVTTENVSNTFYPGDTITYTFNSTIDLSSLVDTNYQIKAWVSLTNDPYQLNDTLTDSVASKVALPYPAINDTTIPYGTSVTLHATHTDSITWSSDPLGANIYHYGASITTPILFDTTEFYLQAGASSGGAFLITEVCHFKTATGAPSGGWPTYLTSDDYIEITGVPNSDLGGFTLEQWNTSLANTHTFPPGTILGSNGTAIIVVGQVSGSPSPSNFYYHGNTTTLWSSNTAAGRILKDPTGNIVDAVGVNGFSFPAAANVPASEWSGSPIGGSGTSGFRLIGIDNNNGSTWVLSSATNRQNPNTINSGVILPAPSVQLKL